MEEADKERKAKADKIVKRSAEEQAERARLLGEYGYDSDPLDEDGNPLPAEEGGEGEGAAVRLVVEGLALGAKPGADRDRWRYSACCRNDESCLEIISGARVHASRFFIVMCAASVFLASLGGWVP